MVHAAPLQPGVQGVAESGGGGGVEWCSQRCVVLGFVHWGVYYRGSLGCVGWAGSRAFHAAPPWRRPRASGAVSCTVGWGTRSLLLLGQVGNSRGGGEVWDLGGGGRTPRLVGGNQALAAGAARRDRMPVRVNTIPSRRGSAPRCHDPTVAPHRPAPHRGPHEPNWATAAVAYLTLSHHKASTGGTPARNARMRSVKANASVQEALGTDKQIIVSERRGGRFFMQ